MGETKFLIPVYHKIQRFVSEKNQGCFINISLEVVSNLIKAIKGDFQIVLVFLLVLDFTKGLHFEVFWQLG